MTRTYTIGCDTSSDIPLADPTVSRHHAGLSVLEHGGVEVVDLDSTNGTFILRNGTRARIAQPTFLQGGDEIAFGELVVTLSTLLEIADHIETRRKAAEARERAPARPSPHGDGPLSAPSEQGPQDAERRSSRPTSPDRSRLREFVPLIDAFQRMKDRGLLFPVVGFGLLVRMLWLTLFEGDYFNFINLLCGSLTVGAFFVVYRLCGKHKPLWVIAAVMGAEWLILEVLFSTVLAPIFRPAFMATWSSSASVLYRFFYHFSGAGLLEELTKMIPVFVIIVVTNRTERKDTARWGVTEPLDAVVYACAAATVFVLVETVGEYVPREIQSTLVNTEGDLGLSVLAGLQLGIARTLNSLPGHLAYSGYFAYFVGLGLLRPLERTRLWVGGWVVASVIHGLGNAVEVLWLRTGIALTALLFLFAVIINARKLSPTRSQNFATLALTRARIKQSSRRVVGT